MDILVQGLKSDHQILTISTQAYNQRAGNNNLNRNKDNNTNEKTEVKEYYLNSLFPSLSKLPIFFRLFWHLSDIFGYQKAGQVIEILKKEKPDLVITHNLKGLGMVTARAIQEMKIRHVHVLHDIQLLHPSGLMYWSKEYIVKSLGSLLYTKMTKYALGKPNLVITPSRWLLSLHLQHGFFKDTKTKYLLNPYSEQQKTKNNQENNQTNSINFLCVGQLAKHKGIDLLLSAFTNLLPNLNANLQIVGIGELEHQVRETSLKHERIQYLGKLPNEEVLKLMRKVNCLIIPSLVYENSPTVILEALRNNLPIIGSDLGGISELLIFPELLFKPNDQDSLEEKIVFAYRHPQALAELVQKIRSTIKQPSSLEYLAKIKKEL